jgi:hypothetical protein
MFVEECLFTWDRGFCWKSFNLGNQSIYLENPSTWFHLTWGGYALTPLAFFLEGENLGLLPASSFPFSD